MFEFIDVRFKDILDIPELKIDPGFTALLGASGGGKTTLLRMLNKLISPTTGRVLYHGRDLQEIPSVSLRRKVLMLSQEPVLFEGNIRDNLLTGFRFQDRAVPGDAELNRVLAEVRLDKDLTGEARTLSGGERQRLALGRLFLLDPDVYLLDEPSSALDTGTEDMIMQLVSDQVAGKDKSVIMITHSRQIAEQYADDLIEMADGRITGKEGRNERNH